MGERPVDLAVNGNTAGQAIHNPTDGERLQVIETFLAQPLPDECKDFGGAFNQDTCDAWVAEAFPIKDHIGYLINNQSISPEEALDLVDRWEALLGHDAAGDPGRIPWQIYRGIVQGVNDPQKPGYHYIRVDYHNRVSEPNASHEGYEREGLGLAYDGISGIEDYKKLLPQLKARRLVGLDYDGSNLADIFGALQSDASLTVQDGRLKVQMVITDISERPYYGSRERTWYEVPSHIASEQSGHIFQNVFDMLVRRRRGNYEDNDREKTEHTLLGYC